MRGTRVLRSRLGDIDLKPLLGSFYRSADFVLLKSVPVRSRFRRPRVATLPALSNRFPGARRPLPRGGLTLAEPLFGKQPSNGCAF